MWPTSRRLFVKPPNPVTLVPEREPLNETIRNTMTYTLGEAAKATGKSKPTISRAIKSGKISGKKDDNGQYELDPAEVHRVFPKLQPASNDTGTMKQDETPNNDSVLQAEIEALQKLLAVKDDQISDLKEDRENWRQQAQKVTALIEDHSQRPKGFFARLLGK